LRAKWWASRIIPIAFEVFSTAAATIGGANDVCVTQVAVIPCSSPSCRTVRA